MLRSVRTFVHSQFFVHPPVPTYSFSGRTIIITGSNVGLGLEAARHIVRLGAEKVILAVRNVTAGHAAKESIQTTTNCSRDVLEVWELDLSSFNSVIAFSERVKTLPRLDGVIENAGVSTRNFSLSEGHEQTITVNILSTILMTLLLLPKLRETAAKDQTRTPTVTIVGSEVHAWARFTERKHEQIFAALSNKDKANMNDRYNTSKLVLLLVIREMVTHLRDESVVINCINPGFCQSQLLREAPAVARRVQTWIGRPTEEGGRTLVAGAAADKSSHGMYMSDGRVAPDAMSKFVTSREAQALQKKLWVELSEILENASPGVLKNL